MKTSILAHPLHSTLETEAKRGKVENRTHPRPQLHGQKAEMNPSESLKSEPKLKRL